jgi:hypothetical protein
MSVHGSLQDRLGHLRVEGDRLLDASPPAERFFRDLLKATIDGQQLLAGIVWMVDRDGRLQPYCDDGLRNVSPDGQVTVGPVQQQQLAAALRDGKVVSLNGPAANGQELPPRVVAPLQAQGRTIGGLEVFYDPERLPAGTRMLQPLMEEWCGYSSRYLDQQRLASQQPQDPTGFWERFEKFTLDLQRSLDVREVSAVAVNDSRLLIGCDRVALVMKEGKRIRVRGISGQDDVEHRANLVSSMRVVARQVVKVGQPIVYRGSIEGLPPQLEKPLGDFLQLSRSRMALFLPLLAPEPFPHRERKEFQTAEQKPSRRAIGCLVVEQFSEARPLPVLRQRADLVCDHVAAALHNARTHEQVFLLPLWKRLGRFFGWFRGRNLWIAAAVAVLLTAVGLALAYVPWDYRVEGLGKTMPVIQREVFAPWDGDVVEILVGSGERVEAAQPLLRIESAELQAELVNARNLRDQKQQLLKSLSSQRRLAEREKRMADAARAELEQVKARIELDGAEQQVSILETRVEALTVRSPIKGVVATFQIEQKLLNRPVRRGEVVLEVMDDAGDWRLELEVPEYRMGHLLRALEASSGKTLPVEYVLATAVETTYQADVTTIATRTNESEEEGTIVEVYADIDIDTLPSRRIGAEVQAKIDCGPRSLFYVLFGDVVEFVQRHFWL